MNQKKNDPISRTLVKPSLLWPALATLITAIALMCFASMARAAAPANEWWDSNYPYRQKISVTAGSTNAPTEYSVQIEFDHAALVTAGKSLSSGNDIRIAHWSGSAWTELDRRLDDDSSWNSSTTQVWFRTQAAINADQTDDNYYLYYGYSSAGTPPTTWSNVFLFYDDFNDGSFDTGRWTCVSAPCTESGGNLTLGTYSKAWATSSYAFGTDTRWETRVQLGASTANYFNYCAAGNTSDWSGDWIDIWSTSSTHYVETANNATSGQDPYTIVTPTSFHVYAFNREGGSAVRFYQDASEIGYRTENIPDADLRFLSNNDNDTSTQVHDWVRVRKYVSPEPTSSIGVEEKTFSNTNPITINDNASAAPYPSTITVPSLSGTVTNVAVTITGLAHTYPDDVRILLVGPQSENVMLMYNQGAGNEVSGVTLTFDDSAASELPDGQITSGTYKPCSDTPQDNMNSPAPAGPYGTSLSVFNGVDPQGDWSLYVLDYVANDSGTISGGWELNITTENICWSSELLTNPGFEAGDAGWASSGQSVSVGYRCENGCDATPHSGSNVAYWTAPSAITNYAHQTVDLSDYASDIDAGEALIDATGWFISDEFSSQDLFWMQVRFYDGSSNEIASDRYDSGTQEVATWTQYGITSYTIPVGARSVEILFDTWENTYGAGSADDFSVKVGTPCTCTPISFDAASNSTGDGQASSISWSHTVTSDGSDPILVVGVSWRNSSNDTWTVSSVTYNSQPLTEIRKDEQFGDPPGSRSTALYYLTDPPTGTNTVQVNFSGTVFRSVGGAVSLTGVDQSDPVDAENGVAGATGTSPSVTVTTNTDGAWAVDALCIRNASGTTSVSGGQTERWDYLTSSENIEGCGSTLGPNSPAGDVTMSWTTGTNDGYSMSAVALKPACTSSGGGGSFDQLDTFETGWGNWTPDVTGDNFDWSIGQNTPSSTTGPQPQGGTTNGEGGSSYFAYIETSSPRTIDEQAYLESNVLPGDQYALSISFYYNMYGAHIDTLYLYVWDGAAWQLDWSRTGDDGGSGTMWTQVVRDLSGYSNNDMKIRFVGETASTSPVYYGDTAIDTIRIYGDSRNSAPDDPTTDDHDDGSTITDNTPTLGFTQSDPDDAEQVQYRIQIDATDNTFSNLVVDYTSVLMAEGATSFTVGQPEGSGSYTVGNESQVLTDGDYFWRVMSTDDESVASGWTQATTGTDVAFTVDTAEGTEILRPVGVGSATNLNQDPSSGSNWDKVDDVTRDNNTTYVYTSVQDAYDLYEVADHTTGSGTINSVTIYAYVARYDAQATKGCIVLRTESTNYFGTGTLINTTQPSYVELTETYTTNPNTGTAWTWDQIDAMEIGIQNLDSGFGGAHTLQCTQMYVVVDYTPGLYRSVGTNGDNLNTDSHTVEISGSTATFSGDMPTNVGVGDVLVYNNGSAQLAFIHGRTSATVFTVKDKDGGTPASTLTGTPVTVYRAYTSLNNCMNSQTENPNVVEPTEDDVNPNRNLVSANTILNVACYGDGVDATPVVLTGWTTGPANYIRIYTPTSTSEVGITQRHSGVWDTNKYTLSTTTSGIYLDEDTIRHVRVDGLQIDLNGSGDYSRGINFYTGVGSVNFHASNNIIRGASGGDHSYGIYVAYDWTGGETRIWNNIVYDSNCGIMTDNGNVAHYVYNNTVRACTYGVYSAWGTSTRAKNNLVQDCTTACYQGDGGWHGDSTNNCSDDGSHPGGSGQTGEVAFENETGNPPDLRLDFTDTVARENGADLHTEFFADDIEGDSRPVGSGWDIGADEATGLIAHWKFDEGTGTNAADSAGTNDGTLEGASGGLPAWTCVIGGSALTFDGDDDEVSLPGPVIGDRAAWSVTAWIKMGADTVDQRTIYSEGDTSADEYWMVYVDDSTDKVKFWSPNGSIVMTGTTPVEDDAWHLVTMVQRSKTDRELYVGTVSQATDTTDIGTLTYNTASIGFLRADGWTADPFLGVIDDVRIYDRALSPAEISTLAASPPVDCGATNQTPSDPTINDHNNGSTITDNTPTLGFTQSDPDDAEQVQYRIQIDATDNTFGNLVVDYTSDFMAEGSASFTVGQPEGSGSYTVGSESQTLADGDYFWRVMTTDDESAASSWTQATTGTDVAFTVDTASTSLSPLIAYSQYGSTVNNQVYYSQYVSGDWSAGALVGTDPNGDWDQHQKVARVSPDSSKVAVVWKNYDQGFSVDDVMASIWDGSSWTDGEGAGPVRDFGRMATQAGARRPLDAAFMQGSGRLLAAVGVGNVVEALNLYLWDGSSTWETGTSFVRVNLLTYGTSELVRWLKLSARPGTNDIVLIASLANGGSTNASVRVAVWDGDSGTSPIFAGGTVLGSFSDMARVANSTSVRYQTEAIDVQHVLGGTYAGDAVAVWGEGQYVYSQVYKSDTSSWDSRVTVWDGGSGNTIKWLRLKPKAEGDDLILAIGADVSSSDRLYTIRYDGDTRSWGSISGSHTNIPYGSMDTNRAFDVIWDPGSGSDNLVLVYSDTTGLRYKTSSNGGSSWNSQQTVSASHQAYWVQLERDPSDDTIHLAIHDEDDDLNTWTWASSTWTFENEITTDLEQTSSRAAEVIALAAYSPAAANQTPNDPTINDHNDGSTITDNTPTLGFTQSDPDDAEQVQYRIQIDATDNTFSNLVVDYTSDFMAEGSASFVVGQAAGSGTYNVGSESQTLADGDYFWRVMTTDDESAASSWTQATTGTDVAFTVDTTSGGSVNLDQVHYRWRNDDGGESGAALAVDATNNGSTTGGSSITIPHTVSGTNRLMLVGVSINNDGGAEVDSVTWKGTENLALNSRFVANSDDARVEIWSLVAPSTGSGDVVIDFGGDIAQSAVAGVVTFTGVDQGTPLGTFASAIGDNSSPATVDVSSAAGELVFGVVCAEYNAVTTDPSQTEHWNTSISGSGSTNAAGSTEAGAAPTITTSWTLNPDYNHWAVGGVSIKPAAGGSGATFDIAEDTELTGLAKNTNTRVRFLVSNSGSTSSGVSYQLEFAETETCGSGSYIAVPTSASGSDKWEIVDSTYYADPTATQDITDGVDDALPNPGGMTFVAGELRDDNSNSTSGITLDQDEFTEIEFTIQATDYALDGTHYCFRLSDSGTDLDSYSYYAEVTLAGVAAATTLADGTDPGDSTVAPGSADQYLDQFTLATNTGSDSVTALTVTTANTDAIASVEIWDDTFSTQYFSTDSTPNGNLWEFSGGTPIPVSTSPTPFRIRFTATGHGSLAEGTYAVTGTVTSFTCTNAQTGTDTDSATITVDNAPPADATWGTITPGDQQVELNWTNPVTDFNKVVILRREGSAVGDAPTDGTEYSVGNTIGGSTVRYVGSLETFTDTGLTNATDYYYKIFAYDDYINYASGTPTGPHTPTAAGTATLNQAHVRWRNDDGTEDGVKVNAGHTTYSSGSSLNDHVINTPSHSEGDVIYIAFACDDVQTITWPAGFTYGQDDIESTATWGLAYKVAGASEPSTYTVSIGTAERAVAIAWSVSNDGGIDGSSTINGGSGATATCNAAATTEANDLVLRIVATDNSPETVTHSTIADYTMLDQVSLFSGASLSVQYIKQPNIGSTGTADVTITSEQWGSATTTIKPAAGGTGATFDMDEDTELTDLSKNTNTRIRFLVSNNGDGSSGAVAYQLEFAETDTCGSGSYSAVPASAGVGDKWHIVDSSYITDGEATSDIEDGVDDALPNPGGMTFIAGELRDDNSSSTSGITLDSNEFTEIEFTIQATDDALDGTHYCFRLTDSGADLDSYLYYAEVTLAGALPNSAPTAPTTPYSNNTTAQSGATNPTGITDPTPAFSAIYNDPDSGDIANKYRVEVNTASDFTGTVMWDSGSGGSTLAESTEGNRCADIIYAGSALADDTQYFWRITFWDDKNTEGAVSATQNFTTGAISSYESFVYRKSIEIDRTKIANPAGTLPIAFDGLSSDQTADTGASSLSWSHTVGSGSERLLVVGVSIRNNSSQTVTGVTYNSTALTYLNSRTNGTSARVEMWYLKEADFPGTPGTYDVAVTLSGSARCVASATSFFNVDQSTPFGSFASATGSGNYYGSKPSVDVANASGQVVVTSLALTHYDPADPYDVPKNIANHQVERWNRVTANATATNNIRGAGALATGSGATITAGWELNEPSATQYWAICGVAVRPTTIAPPQITTLTNYPLLYSVTDDDLKNNVVNAEGWDIVFRALDDTTCGGAGLAPCTLDHEIERYESGTGRLVAWVRVPSVNGAAAGSNTVIYIYYGNSDITSPTENKHGVWDSDFMEVWHLGEKSGDPLTDSTSDYSGTIETPGNVTQDAAGNNTPAYHFAGAQATPSYLTLSDGTMTANAPYAIEGWFYVDTTVPTWWVGFVTKDRDTADPESTANWAGLWTESTEKISFGGIYNKGNNLDGSTLSAGQWYYGVAVFDGGLRTLYLNGQRDPSALVSSPTVYLTDMTLPLRVNQDMPGGGSMTGVFDEVRVSTTVRSPGWILSSYNNMNDPGDIGNPGFYTIGSEQSSASAPTAPTIPYSNDNTAQSGQSNPTDITDPTPAFSAIYNDPDSGDIANKYRVEVNTSSDFTGTVMWDSGVGGTSMSDTTEGNRCADIIYTGSALSDGTQYFWRITFWDDENTEGAVSATQNFTTGTLQAPGTPWHNTDWHYRKHLRIDSSRVAGDLNYFPVLINTTDADWIEDSEPTPGHVAQTDGGDILFTASDGTTKLDHEIEKYDPTTGELIAWVEVPTLSGSIDTGLYIYYGNTVLAEGENQWNVNGTWDEGGSGNYRGVWHLKETPADNATGEHKDSTANANHGTPKDFQDGGGGTTDATGIAAGADDYGTGSGADDRVEISDNDSLTPSGDMTVEAWVKLDTISTGHIVYKRHSVSPWFSYQMVVNALDQALFQWTNSSGTYFAATMSSGSLSAGTWYHLVGVKDGTTVRLYVNGSDSNTTTATTSGTYLNSDVELNIGASYSGGTCPDGIIDEVRISNIPRPAEWIQTQYNNQRAPAAFYTVGIEETYGSGADPFQNGWQYSKKITILASEVAADLTNFPVLINTTHEDWREDDSYGGDVAQSDGGDIVFIDGDRATKLDHEIEKYDPATGELVAWVEVRSLSSTNDNDIYIFYGNADAVDQWNPTGAGVWEPGYKGVWHLKESTGVQCNDSTSNANHGTPSSPEPPEQVSGQFHEGLYFDDDGDADERNVLVADTDNSLDLPSAMTVSAWVKTSDVDSDVGLILMKWSNDTAQKNYWLGKLDGSSIAFYVDDSENVTASLSLINDGTDFHHVVGVADPDSSPQKLRIYVDGIERNSVDWDGTSRTEDADFRIGNSTTVEQEFEGTIDEVRVQSTNRSAAWIETEYNNQKTGSTFYVIDDEWVDPCWDANFEYRKKITITAGSADIPAGYSVCVTLDHAALVTAGKSLANGDDLRVAHWDGESSTWTQLDRALDPLSSWNGGSTQIWFALVDPIAASGSDGTYYLHYGYSSASNPPDDWANVFMVGDDFNDNTLTSGLTPSTSGTASITESGGEAVIDLGMDGGDAGILVTTNPLPSDKKFIIRHKTKLLSGGGGDEWFSAEVKAIGITQWGSRPTVAHGDEVKLRRRIVALHCVNEEPNPREAWIEYNPDNHGGSTQASWNFIDPEYAWVEGHWEKWGNLPLDTYYIYDLVSTGTSWYVRVSDANGNEITTTTPVAWSVIEDYEEGDPYWFFWGEVYTNAYYADQKSDWFYVRSYVDSEPTSALGGEEEGCRGEATAVSLLSFTAEGEGSSVLVEWETAREVDNMGFNLYRGTSPAGPFERLNDRLIPGSTFSAGGEAYSFEDSRVTEGELYYYKLEDIDVYGKKRFHGPICVDWDRDGLPDDWEIAHGLNPSVYDSWSDPDDDGLSNLEEYFRGTDPLNPDTDGDGVLDADEDGKVGREDVGETRSLGKGVQIVAADENGVTLELRTEAYETEIVEVDGAAYQRLRILDYIHGLTQEVGKPELPVKGILLDVPDGASPSLSVETTVSQNYPGFRVYPVPEKTVQGEEGMEYVGQVFAKDEAAYATDAFYPVDVAGLGQIFTFRDQQKLQVVFHPLVFNPVSGELTHYTRIKVRVEYGVSQTSNLSRAVSSPVPSPSVPRMVSRAVAWSPPVSSRGPVYKVFVSEEGIYRMSGSWLAANVINVINMIPQHLRLYNLGREVPIRVYDGGVPGQFDSGDYIEFYGEPMAGQYSKYAENNVYWLTDAGDSGGQRMGSMDGDLSGTQVPVNTHSSTVRYENDRVYDNSAPGADSLDRWFFDVFVLGSEYTGSPSPVPVDFPLNLPDAAGRGSLTITLYAPIDTDHELEVRVNSTVRTFTWSGISYHEVRMDNVDLVEGLNTVTLMCNEPSDGFLVDWFEVTYPRGFVANNDMLKFSYDAGSAYQVSGFTTGELLAFDITTATDVKQIVIPAPTDMGGSYTLDMEPREGSGERTYLVLSSTEVKVPGGVREVVDTDLAGASNGADYILITHRDLGWDGDGYAYPWLSDLVALRQGQGLRVKVVDVEDIYNEFGYGIATPQAIKDFLSYTYNNWTKPGPQYVLLVGDSTYDYKDNLGLGTINFVPAYLSWTEHMGEALTDDWFARVSGSDAIPDLYIGRLPAATVAHATTMVNKIVDYESTENSKSWEKNTLLVADDQTEDYEALFEIMSNDVAALIPAGMSEPFTEYLADYASEAALNSAIKNKIKGGSLIVNYSGHGAVQRWGFPVVFQVSDVEALDNGIDAPKYPFFVSMTCLNGHFGYPETKPTDVSLAEVVLRSENEGAVGAFMSTGMTAPEGQRILDEALFDAIFKQDNRALGLAVCMAKQTLLANGAVYEDVSKTFLLFGDPATRLKVPLPTVPAGVAAQSENGSVVLSWQAAADCNSDPVSGYNIYRSATAGGPYEKVNTAPIAGTGFTDTSAASGTWYYVITSEDNDGYESVASAELGVAAGSRTLSAGSAEGAGGGGQGCFIGTIVD